MVEIKEADIEIWPMYSMPESEDGYAEWNIRYEKTYFSKKIVEQIKQQILQDHEDAKNLREDRDILLKENNELGSQLQDTAKDRQIVKRLQERIDYLKSWAGIRKEWHDRTIEELQKILEEKK